MAKLSEVTAEHSKRYHCTVFENNEKALETDTPPRGDVFGTYKLKRPKIRVDRAATMKKLRGE